MRRSPVPPESRRLTHVALAVVALALGACRGTGVAVSDRFPARGPIGLEDPLKVVVWNIQKAKHPRLHPDLVTLATSGELDLALTQESREDLEGTKFFGSVFAPAWSYPWPGGTTVGLRTYSQVAPVEATPLPSERRELFVTAPKMALATLYPLAGGGRLLALNVHALNFEAFRPTGFRRQLDQLSAELDKHEGPVLLAGDFNTWSSERLALLSAVAARHHLDEVTVFEPEKRKTGDMGSRIVNRVLGIDPELPLDRIFLRGLVAEDAAVLAYDSSDHPPIALELSFEDP